MRACSELATALSDLAHGTLSFGCGPGLIAGRGPSADREHGRTSLSSAVVHHRAGAMHRNVAWTCEADPCLAAGPAERNAAR